VGGDTRRDHSQKAFYCLAGGRIFRIMASTAQEAFMKKFLVVLILTQSVSVLPGSEIVKIKLSDGEMMTGKLDLPPGGGDVRELVIFIAGTGPNTYLNHRKLGNTEFNYFDLFVDEFSKRGVAFFAYNRRGVEIGDAPPYCDTVDKEKYKKYLNLCLPRGERCQCLGGRGLGPQKQVCPKEQDQPPMLRLQRPRPRPELHALAGQEDHFRGDSEDLRRGRRDRRAIAAG